MLAIIAKKMTEISSLQDFEDDDNWDEFGDEIAAKVQQSEEKFTEGFLQDQYTVDFAFTPRQSIKGVISSHSPKSVLSRNNESMESKRRSPSEQKQFPSSADLLKSRTLSLTMEREIPNESPKSLIKQLQSSSSDPNTILVQKNESQNPAEQSDQFSSVKEEQNEYLYQQLETAFKSAQDVIETCRLRFEINPTRTDVSNNEPERHRQLRSKRLTLLRELQKILVAAEKAQIDLIGLRKKLRTRVADELEMNEYLKKLKIEIARLHQEIAGKVPFNTANLAIMKSSKWLSLWSTLFWVLFLSLLFEIMLFACLFSRRDNNQEYYIIWDNPIVRWIEKYWLRYSYRSFEIPS